MLLCSVITTTRRNKLTEGSVTRLKMARLLVTVAILVFVFKTDPAHCGECPKGWTEFQGFYYHISPNVSTWAGAQLHCASSGGSLVKITSAAENDFVLYLSKKFAPVRKQVWIGLGYWAADKKHHWRDGSLPQYSHWAPGEPNSLAREPCGFMYTDMKRTELGRLAGTWNDVICGINPRYQCGYVCEKIK